MMLRALPSPALPAYPPTSRSFSAEGQAVSDTPESTTRVVSVEIQGLRYPIRSDLDEQYIIRLAAYVDAKMQRATNEVPTGESMKIAVLAALNIADELFRARDGATPDHSELLRRTTEIERMVDRALDRLHL
jgi:cell division protein ZapA